MSLRAAPLATSSRDGFPFGSLSLDPVACLEVDLHLLMHGTNTTCEDIHSGRDST